MGSEQILSSGFYIWWLCLNSFLFFAEFQFIQNFAGARTQCADCEPGPGVRRALYVLLSGLLTLLVMYAQSSGVFRLFLHTGIILCFSRFILKIKWPYTIGPAMIILTLFTFMEGFQTVLMRWLAGQEMKRSMGVFVQMLVSAALVLLLTATLFVVSKRYAQTGRQKISSYLYALLFPCVFIVWVIRSGLGLDMWMDSDIAGNQNLGVQYGVWALIWLLGACVLFFIILELLRKIETMSLLETEQKRLEDQIRSQQIYVAEAGKRNEQYRMFQHDIHNHFLVLSGLFREKKYEEAGKYFDSLHGVSGRLLTGIETGNPVVDILLNEKISYARANGIVVRQEVCLPSDCRIEDLDLCIILANALDNAIQACMSQPAGRPEISIMVRRRYDFLIMEIENTFLTGQGEWEAGTGLRNMKYAVERYEGTMEIEAGSGRFRLTILLCLKPFTKSVRPFTKTFL